MINSAKDDEKVQSFAVRNTNYYRDKWKTFQDKPGSVVSVNWAAGFGQVMWLASTKLYVPLFFAVFVYVATVWLSMYVDDRQVLSDSLSAVFNWIMSFLFLAVFGLLGNHWSWSRCRYDERQAVDPVAGC